MGLRRHALALSAGWTLCVSINACAPNLPPLIQGATAARGYLGVCPEDIALLGEPALSPELNARLNAQFPAGSQESALVAELVKQGFVLDEDRECKGDRAIRSAIFKRDGFYTTYAYVYWKADVHHRVRWTKGIVAFDGL
jgi:hypothetical protein